MTKDSTLLADLYHAAVDPSRWEDLLDRVALSVGARGAVILALNTAPNDMFKVSFANSLYRDRDLLSYYRDNLAHYETPVIERAMASTAGTPLTEHGIGTESDRVVTRPDVTYLLEHFGVLHRVAMRLNDDRGRFEAVACQFDAKRGPARAPEIIALQRLRPFIAQSLLLARGFRRLRQRYDAVLGVLDRLLVAVFVVGDDGVVITRNSAADVLLEVGGEIGIDSRGRLRAYGDDASRELAGAIADAIDTARSRGSTASRLVVLPAPDRGAPCIADVSPLNDSDDELDADACAVMVTIVDPRRGDVVDLSGFDIAYKLSASEAAVARLLVDGLTYAEMAETRNVLPTTVKTQVRSLLTKTGARNRTELTRLALALNVPVQIRSRHEGVP